MGSKAQQRLVVEEQPARRAPLVRTGLTAALTAFAGLGRLPAQPARRAPALTVSLEPALQCKHGCRAVQRRAVPMPPRCGLIRLSKPQ